MKARIATTGESTRPAPRRGTGGFGRCASPSAMDYGSSALRGRSFHLLADDQRVRHGLVQLVGVELTLPAADHHAGDAVADEVGERAAFAHEFVDAEQECKRRD